MLLQRTDVDADAWNSAEAAQLHGLPQSQDIPCIPPADRRPRWASQHDGGGSSGVRTSTAAATSMGSGSTLGPIPGGAASSSSINHILGRVQNLEGMVKQLSAQLEQKRAVPAVSSDMIFTQPCPSEHQQSAPAPAARSNVSGVREQQFGRLVLKDSVDRSPYVTSGFWSQISDELDELRMDVHVLAGAGSGSSEGEVESGRLDDTDEPAGSPFERHAFLFRHNLGPTAPDLGNLKPLPSQIPFLLGVFHENINSLGRLVHMPTITKMVRASQNAKMPTPAHEALIFSIYYTAVVSMEEEDVTLNFGSSKADLSMRYRLGLEYAMAKADFLNSPDIVCLQALIGFLWLLRRQGSPKFVWMMTGLAVRLAQYLGLQRDGAEFIHLTPFEVEMRRRIWWNLYALDLRAAEDQGTDPAIPTSSYGTEIPSNIDDADIDPETVTVPSERAGLSELSFFRMVIKTGIVMRQMMNVKLTSDSARLHELEALLQRMCQTYEQEYGQYTREKGGIAHWMGATLTRLAVAKMTLLVFLPVLLAPSDTRLSNHVRNRLLVAAIEVAEYNHALNSEPTCRKWRWIFQTYIHWYSIVYLMLEISRRPWSSICERAWIALHSGWLIPSQTLSAKNLRVWIPLRKLMARVHKHHNDEYRRLRADAHAVARLDQEDQEIPEPATSELFPTEASTIIFRNRWCELINTPQTPEGNVYPSSMISDTALADHMPGNFHSAWMSSNRSTAANNFSGTTDLPNYTSLQANAGLPVDSSVELNSLPWPWAGFDASMDPFNGLEIDPNYAEMAMEDNVDWYGWVESARDMESGNRQN